MTRLIKSDISYNNWLLQLKQPSLRKKLDTVGKSRKSAKGRSSKMTLLISVPPKMMRSLLFTKKKKKKLLPRGKCLKWLRAEFPLVRITQLLFSFDTFKRRCCAFHYVPFKHFLLHKDSCLHLSFALVCLRPTFEIMKHPLNSDLKHLLSCRILLPFAKMFACLNVYSCRHHSSPLSR